MGDRQFGRDRRNYGEGVSVNPASIPRWTPLRYNDFAGGYDVRDEGDQLPQNVNYGGVDTEVSRKDRIIRAPGNTAFETLTGRTPEQIAIHAGLDFRSELLLFDAPFFGIKRDAATTWVDLGLPAGVYFWATYGNFFVFSQGTKVYRHEFGTDTATLDSIVPTGKSFASWAGRFWSLGALIDGNLEPLGIDWSGVNNFDDRSDLTGWGFEFLINDTGIGDRGVALRPMGFDYMAILNRRSIWIARRTGDLLRPADFQPRVPGEGCVSERTARTTSAGVIYLSDEGVKLFDGNEAKHISAQIDPEIVPINLTKIGRYWSTYNPHTQRYYLGVPDVGTYVLDIVRGRWSKRSLKAIDAIPFSTQFDSTTWAEAVGSWDVQTLNWADMSPPESDVPSVVFLGQKADAVHYLEKESSAGTSYFGYAQDPIWINRVQADQNDKLVSTNKLRLKYLNSGSFELQLPDINGNLEFAVQGDLALSVQPAVRKQGMNHTGLGGGFALRYLSGDFEIAGVEIDVLTRAKRVGLTIGEFLAAPTNLVVTVVSSARLDLTWDDNSFAETGIEVWRKAGAGAYALLATLPANSESYTDLAVVAGTLYTYKVRAVKT